MILYFADKNFRILGTASTSLSGGYVITDDTKKEEVETGIATLDCTVAYTYDTRADIESWCRAGNYVLAYYGKETAADMDIVNLFMITTTELSVLDHTIKFESEDSGLDLLNNLAKEYTGTEQMSAADYINKFLEKTGFRLRNNNVSKNPKKLEWTSTDTVTKRLADIAEKFDAELTYGFSVKGLTVSDRWVDIADETGKDTKINLFINKEVNNITVKNTIENLATALYATGKDNLTLIGFTVPEEDKEKYQIDPDGNLVSLEALTKWARVDYSSKDSFTGNLYQKFESSDTASQADLYKLAKEKLDSISDIETNYEIDIADLPPGVGIGDRVNIVDDAGNTYISGRILELETSVTDGTKKATLGEYVIKDSGISELVENLASSFANLSKVRELYTWIAYADTIDGDGFSFSPEGKEYLGTAVNQLTEEAGTDPAVYKWVKTKGEQGEKGPTGAPGEKGDPGEDGYSPTVDLSTGASGSTVLTVTNKTGQSSTELKDQKARNDADNATESAELAQQQAESATTAAETAHSAAQSATSDAYTAGKAAATAQAAAEAAQGDIDEQKKYFYHDKLGAHVLDAAGGKFRTDVKSSGLYIVDASTEKTAAFFGANNCGIGGGNMNNINISESGVKINNGVYPLIDISAVKTGEDTVAEKFSFPGEAAWEKIRTGATWSAKYTLKDEATSVKLVKLGGEYAPYEFNLEDINVNPMYGYIINGKDLTIFADGSYVETTSYDWDRWTDLEIEYSSAVVSGTVEADKFNVKNEIMYKDYRGLTAGLTQITSGTGKLTLTTGAVAYQPRWWRCGNLVQMEVSTKCTGAVGSGANIAAGKITGVPEPITESGVRAVSYYGNNANISYMGSDGTFYARNAGSDALAKGNDCIGGFTYITTGKIIGATVDAIPGGGA